MIYPGGADQPPKEKDTGVSLKVDKIIGHGSAVSERDDLPLAPGQAALETLLVEGRPEEILRIVGSRSDPLSRTYRALALLDLGKISLARQEADQALAQRRFPPDLRARLEEAFSESDPIDANGADSFADPDLTADSTGQPPPP
ncbi:MAG: hypothetical protein OZSIB_4336 [Candidatus Ozemobacter sibiricus]|uniref:Uncharacterized protein n=1 Tax=Candidatus Ozemobacter sibiricus TaxID=2268124 RepID=A0A367ZQD2_9BACT|nr:MAG: hypothetical protein OZSIB_4336 [Candidatus Ozemobacter sibiricus]